MKFFFILFILIFSLQAEEKAKYRTDQGNEKAEWYKLKKGEFPPEDAAHYLSGELIKIDHVTGSGRIRLDRSDSQSTGEYDAPLQFTLMPYATVRYNGAYASIMDIPLGTHLHGKFFRTGAPNTLSRAVGNTLRYYQHGDPSFDQAVLLEDDFSFYQRQNQSWKVLNLDLGKKTVEVQLNGTKGAKPKKFKFTNATRVWKGKSVVELKDLKDQQEILFNFSDATFTGPGRITEIWLDKESQEMAANHQKQKHIVYRKRRGVPAQVIAVDNVKKTVTVTLLAGTDEALLSSFKNKQGISLAVANENLRTYHHIHDAAHGKILDLQKVPATAYDSGIRFTFKANVFLEGYRPNEIIMFFKWGIVEIPREERLYK